MILLVTYELKGQPGKSYDKLYSILKSSNEWWHYLDSTWIIDTNDTVKEFSDKILQAIDGGNDNFLVVEITGQSRQGWLPTKAWEWLKKHDPKIL